MDAEKAPFFVEKLAIRVLPTVVCFREGVAFPERVVGFEGLADAALSDEQRELQAFGSRSANRRISSSDEFPTSAVRAKLLGAEGKLLTVWLIGISVVRTA